MPIAAPFISPPGNVLPLWVNNGGHIGLAYYLVLFDAASYAFFEALGIGEEYTARTGYTYFAGETHVIYEQEMRLGDTVRIHTTVLDSDSKRLHLAHEMYRNDEPARVCLQETVYVSVSLDTRRSTLWPPEAVLSIEEAMVEHKTIQRPAKLGRSIGIRR